MHKWMEPELKRVLVSNIMMLKERERFHQEIINRGYLPVWAQAEQHLKESECLDLVGDIDGWLAGDDRITRLVLERSLPRLKVISKWGTGIDSIDLDAAQELGIPVKNSPAAFSSAVAEVALHFMLSLARRLVEVDRGVRAGHWPKPQGQELHGRTLGLLGFGAIGRRIGELAVAFGMKVIFFDPFVTTETMLGGSVAYPRTVDALAAESDFLCLACSYNQENHHIVNDALLRKMKPSAFLINVARGPLVDQRALVVALQQKLLAGAGLDVFEIEPLPSNDPLLTMNNVVLGSHNANNGRAAVEHVHLNTLNNLTAILG